MTLRYRFPLASLTAALLAASPMAFAADKEHPDSPCLQKKVETISASQVWDGPAIDKLTGWEDDEAIQALVKEISNRAIPIDRVKTLVDEFAKAQPEASRDQRLTLLFAALFNQVGTERKTILAGIEKYNRRQKERAKILEDKGNAIAELEGKGTADPAAEEALAKAQEDYDWESRIFKDRSDNMTIACELPVIIDQRLFEVAKEIRVLMKV